MDKEEAFVFNMRLYRSLVFKWSREENDLELKNKVYDLEKKIIQSVYPDKEPLWPKDFE